MTNGWVFLVSSPGMYSSPFDTLFLFLCKGTCFGCSRCQPFSRFLSELHAAWLSARDVHAQTCSTPPVPRQIRWVIWLSKRCSLVSLLYHPLLHLQSLWPGRLEYAWRKPSAHPLRRSNQPWANHSIPLLRTSQQHRIIQRSHWCIQGCVWLDS